MKKKLVSIINEKLKLPINKYMNSKKIGESLENTIHYDLRINKTKNSGQSKHDADLKDKENFIIECKYRNQKKARTT